MAALRPHWRKGSTIMGRKLAAIEGDGRCPKLQAKWRVHSSHEPAPNASRGNLELGGIGTPIQELAHGGTKARDRGARWTRWRAESAIRARPGPLNSGPPPPPNPRLTKLVRGNGRV